MFELTLSQIFVAAMVISQILTDPSQIKTEYNPQTDQQMVIDILRKGCPAGFDQFAAEFGLTFKVQDMDLSQAVGLVTAAGEESPIPGVKFTTIENAHKMFCKGQDIKDPDIKIDEVINEYNKILANLPDLQSIKGMRLPQASVIQDVFGERFTEVYKDGNRRKWISIDDLPPYLPMAFIAAEDKRFYEHHGVDVRGVLRAFMKNQTAKSEGDGKKKRRPEGGSTITQQVIKNLLVGGLIPKGDNGPGDEITASRKIREMVVAARLEQTISKKEILELYLNYVMLGRASWGVEMAAQSYFGKSARQVTKLEAAFLAGLTKGPNFFNADVYPDRVKKRTAIVLAQMQKLSESGTNKFLSTEEQTEAQKIIEAWDSKKPAPPEMLKEGKAFGLVSFAGPIARKSFYFLDDIVQRTAKNLGVKSILDDGYVVKTTLHPELQPIVEASVQESLAEFEMKTGRARWRGPIMNIKEDIEDYAQENPDQKASQAWYKTLLETKVPLHDVAWPIAVVVVTGSQPKVGLKDGRFVPLKAWNSSILRTLKLWDVVYIANATGNTVELRTPPTVQGAAVILENRSGRVLAMSGGFSYVQSQYNRATRMIRQPGSTVKPLTYLVALQSGISPNATLVDQGVSFNPIQRGPGARVWGVGPGSGRVLSVRQGLETSNNQITAGLLYRIGRGNPVPALDAIQNLCMEIKLCQGERPFRGFPFILGSHDVRLIDLASFYATIANEGVRARPYLIESISKEGHEVFSAASTFKEGLTQIQSVRPQVFREVKSMLQGVLARGTARQLASDLAPFVGGKTGTTNNSKNTWFAGFTNDITIATWVGYDDQRSLGGNEATGGYIALPIFNRILRRMVAEHAYNSEGLVRLNAPHPEMASTSARGEYYAEERTQGPSWWPEPRQQTIDPWNAYRPPPEDNDEIRRQRRGGGNGKTWGNWDRNPFGGN